jgi:2-oxo-4-hydroxy-4-carboxy-5-ureidoimidazoline decarboxylase
MCARRPFGSLAELLAAADEEWARMGRYDVLEAFEHHPRIGGDLDALRQKFSAAEQAGVDGADEATLVALRDGTRRYEERFGHVFIVCATGRSAAEMLASLLARIGNEPSDELRIAAAEQAAITRLRLRAVEQPR